MRWSVAVVLTLLLAGCAAPPPQTSSSPAGPHGAVPSHRDVPTAEPGLTILGEASIVWNGTFQGLAEQVRFVGNGSAFVVLAEPAPQPSSNGDVRSFEASGPPQVHILLGSFDHVAGEPISFAAHAYDPDSQIIDLRWDFGDGGMAHGYDVVHTFVAAGRYVVALTAVSSDGDTASRSLALDVRSVAAPVRFDVAPTSPRPFVLVTSPLVPPIQRIKPGQPLNFSAVAFGAAGNETYAWDFGDGVTARGRMVTHAYAAEGNYIAVVRVTTWDGRSDEAVRALQVAYSRPVVIVREWAAVLGGVRLTAEAWDYDGAIVSTTWELGNGTTRSGSDLALTDQGTYTVTAIVVDDDGFSASATRTVTVTGHPPSVLDIRWQSGTDPKDLTFSGGASDPDGTIMSYAWEFGDGSTGEGNPVTHHYAAGGTYTVRLTVTDDDGLSASTIRSVPVPA